jgi:hypothetical protein
MYKGRVELGFVSYSTYMLSQLTIEELRACWQAEQKAEDCWQEEEDWLFEEEVRRLAEEEETQKQKEEVWRLKEEEEAWRSREGVQKAEGVGAG